jgi:hypothetical protein
MLRFLQGFLVVGGKILVTALGWALLGAVCGLVVALVVLVFGGESSGWYLLSGAAALSGFSVVFNSGGLLLYVETCWAARRDARAEARYERLA